MVQLEQLKEQLEQQKEQLEQQKVAEHNYLVEHKVLQQQTQKH